MVGQRHNQIPNIIKIQEYYFYLEVLADLLRIILKNRTAKLRSFFQSVAGDPCLAEVVLFNITWYCLSITPGFVRLVWFIVVIDIVGAKPIQSHVRSPVVIPEFKFLAQLC